MGTTTFSGPIKAGTIKETTGTTVGTDMKNTGTGLMAQTAAIRFIGATCGSRSNVIIPANSQIIDCVFDIITAAMTSTNIKIGFVGGSATALVNAYTIGTTVGYNYPTTSGWSTCLGRYWNF